MNRALALTLASMTASLAAALVSPTVDAAAHVALLSSQAEASSAQGTSKRPEAALTRTPESAPLRTVSVSPVATSACAPEASATYVHWHHGSLKLMPGCMSPAASS